MWIGSDELNKLDAASLYRALASVWGCATADSASLPAQRIYSEHLILPAGPAELDESCSVSRLGLNLGCCLVLLGLILLWDRFCNPLKVFFAELELRHSPTLL